MKKLCVISLFALIGIFCACNKPKRAPEVVFTIHDTIEYFYDQEVKARIVCSVDCDLSVDTIWWHVPGDGWEGEYFLMQEQNGKYIDIICPYAGLELDYCYRLSIGGWRYRSDWYELHVQASDLDPIVP